MKNNLEVLQCITKGNAFTLKFEKTLIYKVQNGKETLIDSFSHSETDDYYATFKRLSSRYGGGLCTSLTFNKFERLQNNGLFKGLYNAFDFLLLPDDWRWHKVDGGFDLIEYPVYSDNFASLCVYTSASNELGMLLFIDDGYSICYKIAFTRLNDVFIYDHC